MRQSNRPLIFVGLLLLLVSLTAGVYFLYPFTSEYLLTSAYTSSHIVTDGYAQPWEWQDCDPVHIKTAGGANFVDGVSTVTIHSKYNKQKIFFLIEWDDPTRSYNRFLVKENGYWKINKTEPEPPNGETKFYEDQLALFFSKEKQSCFTSCHFNSHKKNSDSDSSLTDVWYWKALSTNPVSQADDGWFGFFEDSLVTNLQYDNKAGGGMYSNLNLEWSQPYFFQKFRRNKYWINLATDNAIPYFTDIDTLPDGVMVPEVLIGPMSGDRSDIKAKASWHRGKWSLEMTRARKTGSPYDMPMSDSIFFTIALFDNASLDHSIGDKPVKLILLEK